jgi:hypothetical protein
MVEPITNVIVSPILNVRFWMILPFATAISIAIVILKANPRLKVKIYDYKRDIVLKFKHRVNEKIIILN